MECGTRLSLKCVSHSFMGLGTKIVQSPLSLPYMGMPQVPNINPSPTPQKCIAWGNGSTGNQAYSKTIMEFWWALTRGIYIG